MKSQYPVRKLKILNFWITFYFFIFGNVMTIENFGNMPIENSIIGSIYILSIAFANLFLILLLERLKKNNKIIFIILSYTSSYIVFIILSFFTSTVKHNSFFETPFLLLIFISILINTLVLLFQNYVIIQEEKKAFDIENSKLRAANADAANQLLKQQIHPHFLFNALNILKSLYKTDAKAGEKYLIHLSNFLRSAISTNDIKVIPIKEEIKLCEDYLEMQKIRFGDALNYSFLVSEETTMSGFVPSFSIQPLLENAIKHNEITEEHPLNIEIKEENDRINVTNNIKQRNTSETSTGNGLLNLSERYQLLSKDDLIIKNTKKTFSVSIKILDHENSNNRR